MTPNRQFSLALDSLKELRLHLTQADQTQPTPVSAPLSGVLSAIGPLPREALFLGIASDGLPVLLNLHDPHPGPVLIVGESDSGKTTFLRSIARATVQTHGEGEVQFAVITNKVHEWDGMDKTPHHVGVFDVNDANAQDLIRSLSSWAHSNKDTRQSVLLLVDDLESIARLDLNALQDFRWLLLRGPARHVWPFITMSAERYGQVLSWINIFRTRVFGRIVDSRVAHSLGGDRTSALYELEAGRQFSLRENGKWLRFTIPSF